MMTASVSGTTAASSALTGTGVLVQGMTVSPSQLDFGRLSVGAYSLLQTVTITNTAAVEQIVAMSVSGDGPEGFMAIGGCGITLGAGKSCDLPLVFRPVRAGPHRGHLVVGSPGPANGTAELLGEGLGP